MIKRKLHKKDITAIKHGIYDIEYSIDRIRSNLKTDNVDLFQLREDLNNLYYNTQKTCDFGTKQIELIGKDV